MDLQQIKEEEDRPCRPFEENSPKPVGDHLIFRGAQDDGNTKLRLTSPEKPDNCRIALRRQSTLLVSKVRAKAQLVVDPEGEPMAIR